jgi:PAS domain S-box-containing protein
VLALDLGLPDSEGTGTVEAAVQAAPKLPIVVLTGQEQLDVALRVQGAGAADYLQKGELTPGLTGRTLRWAAQRSRMQQKLRQRDAWIRSITESLSVGVFRTGPKGHVKYANEALAEMLGFESGEEVVGRDLTGFYAEPHQQEPTLAQKEAEGAEVRLKRKDGREFVGLLSARAAYDGEGRLVHYNGTITDIHYRAKGKRGAASRFVGGGPAGEGSGRYHRGGPAR